MIDQARIDKAAELILGGAMHKDVAKELGVSQATVSRWDKNGLIPPTPSKKKKKPTTARSGTMSPCRL